MGVCRMLFLIAGVAASLCEHAACWGRPMTAEGLIVYDALYVIVTCLYVFFVGEDSYLVDRNLVSLCQYVDYFFDSAAEEAVVDA